MYLTVDISRYTDLDANLMELNLADAGSSLQVMKTTQLRPFKKFNLPEPASHQDQILLKLFSHCYHLR